MTLAHDLYGRVAENKNPLAVNANAQNVEAARLGWRESHAHPCLLTVAGRRGSRHGVDCPCMPFLDASPLDHVRLWLNETGDYVLTSEPYGLRGRDIADFVAVLDGLGLEAQFSAYSAWLPLSTLRIIVTKKESA